MPEKDSTELDYGPNLAQTLKSWELLGIEFAEVRLSCRKRFKEVLKLPEPEKVEFNAHSDSERAGGSSRAKTKMTV